MTIRIAARTYLAFPLAGLLAAMGACQSAGGTVDTGTGGKGSGGRASGGRGGGNSGGAAGTGQGGEVGGQAGSGAAGAGGSNGGRSGSGGSAGAGGSAGGRGGNVGRDAAAPGTGGSSGQGGSVAKDAGKETASALDAGPVACDDIESSGRLAVYDYDDSEVSGSSIQMHFDIVNYTAFTSRLTQVTVRYWFTDEGASLANVVEQYYVPIPTTMKFITLNPPRAGADTVLEMSFPVTPDSGVSWVETRGFNFAFHKTSYQGTYDQSNDYSYDAKLTKTLGPNPKITAYVNGALAWGCEPPVQLDVIDASVGVPDAPIGAVEVGQGNEPKPKDSGAESALDAR